MISYSKDAKRLVATFKQYRNDVDIFTEDERKDREFYSVLFKRLLSDSDILINDITPLGCRSNVIARCKSEPNNGRRKLFIVDGDIYVLYNKEKDKHENLFVLDSYCIENYIVDEHSCSYFAYTIIGTEPFESVKRQINFKEWLASIANPFIDLFIHFSILHQIKGKFSLYNANKYINKNTVELNLIQNEINDIKHQILEVVSFHEYNELLHLRENEWSKTPVNFLKIVSGKDYILPLVQLKIQEFRKTKGLFTNESAKTFFAHHCKLDRLENLKNAIIGVN